VSFAGPWHKALLRNRSRLPRRDHSAATRSMSGV
jgi:hypothetical protein